MVLWTIIIYILWPCGFVDDNNIHSMAVWFCGDNNIHSMAVWFCGDNNIHSMAVWFCGR